MKSASETLRIVTHEDAGLAKKPLMRAGEFIADGEPDPNKLMDLLGDIDSLKLEIHERMRRIEAVKHAKSVLLEDALRTEALNKKLAEIGKVMSAVHSGLPLPALEQPQKDTPVLEIAARAIGPDVYTQPAPMIVESEALPILWHMQETAVEHLPEEQESLAPPSAEQTTGSIEEDPSTTGVTLTYKFASERLEQTEDAQRLAAENALQAQRLLEESTQRLEESTKREERLAADFQSAYEALSVTTQAANERLAEAERCWREADQATTEAKRLLEQSAAELEQARKREESIEANLQSLRHEFSAAYQSAGKRLEEAQRFWQKGDQLAQETQQLVDQSTAELLQARNAEETAAADLISARQELTTAYQFAAVAAQRRLDAVEFFQKSTRWMVFGTALSWCVMAWVAWLSLRTAIPIWGPGAATVVIVLLSVVMRNVGMRGAEGG